MSPEEFADKMIEIASYADEYGYFDDEVAHVKADNLMCALLRSLGYQEGVRIFENLPKYYS